MRGWVGGREGVVRVEVEGGLEGVGVRGSEGERWCVL